MKYSENFNEIQPFLAENNTKTQTFTSDKYGWRFE